MILRLVTSSTLAAMQRTPADELSHAEATYDLSSTCFSNKSKNYCFSTLMFLPLQRQCPCESTDTEACNVIVGTLAVGWSLFMQGQLDLSLWDGTHSPSSLSVHSVYMSSFGLRQNLQQVRLNPEHAGANGLTVRVSICEGKVWCEPMILEEADAVLILVRWQDEVCSLSDHFCVYIRVTIDGSADLELWRAQVSLPQVSPQFWLLFRD